MKGEWYSGGTPLSYFHRDLEIVARLSSCITGLQPETVVNEAMEIARFIRSRILRMKPELGGFLCTMEATMRKRLASRETRFRYDELYQLSLLAKTMEKSVVLRRFLCAYKMMLSVSHAERLFTDAVLIYFSAIIEDRKRNDMDPENDPAIMHDMEIAIGRIIANLVERENGDERCPLPPFVTSPDRERECDYIARLRSRQEMILERRSRPIRKAIMQKRCLIGGFAVPEHAAQRNFGYKFRKCLYSNHAQVLKMPCRMIQEHTELSRKAYSLYISMMTMDAFRDDETLHQLMDSCMDLMRMNLDGKATKREVTQALVRLAAVAEQERDDATCYQVESFVNAMEAAMGQQACSRAIRTDLSASLESNYQIQSPRKTHEIISYHMESMSYMDEVAGKSGNLRDVMAFLEDSDHAVMENAPPYRPDMCEMDMEHLESGASHVVHMYEEYRHNTRSPLPLDEKLMKDSIDELLLRTDDIRYEIYSIVPDEEDARLYRSMNFDIRDIF